MAWSLEQICMQICHPPGAGMRASGSHCLGRHPPRLSLHTTYCEGGIASTHTTSSVLILTLRTDILCTFLESSCTRLSLGFSAI